MTKEEILYKLKKHKKYIQNNFGVDKIGLVGSYAKDLQNQNSDIDIYVEFKEKTFENLTGLWLFLEEQFDKKVDIIYPHKNSNKIIINNIKKDIITPPSP